MMAPKRQALMLILLSLFTFSFSTVKSSQEKDGVIAIYWGQNNGDGTLTATCDTGNYKIVLLAFLVQFGCDREIKWNFAGHCGDWSPCTKLQPEIEHCQSKGIKVLLSLGGADVRPTYEYGLCSKQDAKSIASYLYTNFLSGQYGPLGSVTLDGIDFDIERTDDYWDDLARELDTLRHPNKKFYLSAAPQCPFKSESEKTIYYLDKAIKTFLFDYIFIQFYNNPSCSYSETAGAKPVLDSWDKWTTIVPSNNSLFVGLPAAPSAGNGYMPPQVLISDVLPHVKQTPNYGGVMLWDRYRDVENHYSDQILPYVLNSVLRSVTAVSDAIFECVSAALRRILPRAV